MSFVKSLESAAGKQGINLATAFELYSEGHFLKHLKPTAEDTKDLIQRIAVLQRTLDGEDGDVGEEKESKGKGIGEKLGERIAKSRLMPAELYRDRIETEEVSIYNQFLVGGYDERELENLVKKFTEGVSEYHADFADLQFAAGVAIALQGLDYEVKMSSKIGKIDFLAPDKDGKINMCHVSSIMVHTVRARLFASGERTDFIRIPVEYSDKTHHQYPSKAYIDRMLEILHEADTLTDPVAAPDPKDEKLVTIKSGKL